MSGSRLELGPADVARLVGSQFPEWADLVVRPVEHDGWDNRTFRLGDDKTVRLPSAAAYAAQVPKEQQWLPRLAPYLPLSIPVPLAMGRPGDGYPWHWSVYRWLDGETASAGRIRDLCAFATGLARFLVALQRIDPAGGPAAGPHNFFRGGPLTTYDGETRAAIGALGGEIDGACATRVWEAGLAAAWRGPAVWLHGDVSASNVLVRDGGIRAVIDFGSCGVGDPACDLTIAWTLLAGESREAFRAALAVDESTWLRGRGWALWKALITLAEPTKGHTEEGERARRVIDALLSEGDSIRLSMASSPR